GAGGESCGQDVERTPRYPQDPPDGRGRQTQIEPTHSHVVAGRRERRRKRAAAESIDLDGEKVVERFALQRIAGHANQAVATCGHDGGLEHLLIEARHAPSSSKQTECRHRSCDRHEREAGGNRRVGPAHARFTAITYWMSYKFR